MQIKGIHMEISHPEKILFGNSGITKLQLAEYYAFVYPYMKIHIDGRPISMERFPNGIYKGGFYQKEAADYFPSYIKRVRVPLKTQPTKQFITIDNPQTLIFLANQANIPVHAWLSRRGRLTKPDLLVWDFDPNDRDFEKVRECAFLAKALLRKYKIDPFLKLTGSNGVHLVVPILPNQIFEKVKSFALHVAEILVQNRPDLMTLEMSKSERGDKVFVDYLRNSYAATAVAPYSVRPRENAPVAMPITWKELESNKIKADSFNIGNALKRIKAKGDIWKDFFKKPLDLRSITILPE
jgi:bifunctional non-homologous end joining protein LigD